MLWRRLLVYLPVNLAQALAAFGAVAVFTRLMPPEQYGRYALLAAGSGFAITLAFTWIDASIIRFWRRLGLDGRKSEAAASAALSFGACAAVAALLFAAVFLPMDPTARGLINVMAAIAAFVLRSIAKTLGEIHRASERPLRFAFIQTTNHLSGFVFGVALFMVTPLGEAAPFLGMALGAAFALILAAGDWLRPLAARADPKLLADFARFGAPVTASLLLEQFLNVGDRFLLVWLKGYEAAGLYAAAYGVALRILEIVFVGAALAGAPAIVAALERRGTKAAQARLRRFAYMLALVAFPAAVGLILVNPSLVTLFLGEPYRPAALALTPILVAAGFAYGAMTFYVHEAFTLAKRTGLMAAIMAAPALANIVLNLLLIPPLGIEGAAWATLASYLIGLAVSLWAGLAVFPLPLPWAGLLRTAGAAAAMGLVLWVTPTPEPGLAALILQAGLGALVFALAAYALDAPEARRLARPMLARLRGVRA